jgi:hypothetical protein
MRGRGHSRTSPGFDAAVGLALALLASPASAFAPRPPAATGGVDRDLRFVDYLYIRANEGGSSGGHAAIRFDASVFHFQHDRGLLRLVRDDWSRFEHVYRTLQNRDIELNRIAVTSETYERLDRAFRRRHLVQEQQLAILATIQRDARWLEALTAPEAGALPGEPVSAPGIGFFADEGPAPGVLLELRRRIEAVHGADFLERRSRQIDAAAAAITAAPVDVDAIALDPRRYPAIPPSFAERSEALLSARAALGVLVQPRPLRSGVTLSGPGAGATGADALALDASETARLAALSQALLQGMVRLVASRRYDWGSPLLLGMARLVALEASIRGGRWVLLDTFPPDADTIRVNRRRRSLLPPLLDEATVGLAQARRALLDGQGWREADYNDLETAATRWSELHAARAGASEVRIQTGRMVAQGRAAATPLPVPTDDGVALARRLEQTREAEQRYRRALRKQQSYHLLLHNCVSEIFRTLEVALADATFDVAEPDDRTPDVAAPESALRRASRQQLGGYVHPVARLNFIPFVSSHQVRTHYAVAQTVALPSYRHFHLARMLERESPLRVALRESNVVTSTLHAPVEDEGFFLFFTDGGVAPRPLLGALNLVAGLGRSALGLLQLPLDRGRGLRSGLSGAFFSLPELFFQNIRKGTNEYVRPEDRPPPAGA